MVAPFDHRDALTGPSNSRTLSATTQPGNKSGTDKATEGTSSLGRQYRRQRRLRRQRSRGVAIARTRTGTGTENFSNEKVVIVKPYSAEIWVYRCRVAAVINALILLTVLIVALVVITSTNHYCVSNFYSSWVAVIYYTYSTTHGPPTLWDKRHRRTLSWRELPIVRTVQYYTSCIIMSCRPSSPNQRLINKLRPKIWRRG